MQGDAALDENEGDEDEDDDLNSSDFDSDGQPFGQFEPVDPNHRYGVQPDRLKT